MWTSSGEMGRVCASLWVGCDPVMSGPLLPDAGRRTHESRCFLHIVLMWFHKDGHFDTSVKPALLRTARDFSQAVTFGGSSLGRRKSEKVAGDPWNMTEADRYALSLGCPAHTMEVRPTR